MKTLGENIREARNIRGLTQEELANLLNVKKQTVYRWEKGERSPDYDTLRVIAMQLSVNVSELIGDSELPEEQDENLGLKSINLKYWEDEASKIRKLIYAESQDVFAQVEDIYIKEFNNDKNELYLKNNWIPPSSSQYTFPHPQKLGGYLGRIYINYKTKPCGNLNNEDRIGYRIRLYREKFGMTLEQLADKLSLDPEIVWKWENLQDCDPEPQVERLAKILNIPVAEFIGAMKDTSDSSIGCQSAIAQNIEQLSSNDTLLLLSVVLQKIRKEIHTYSNSEISALENTLDICKEILKSRSCC